MNILSRVLVAFGVLAISFQLSARSPFSNIGEIQRQLGFEPYYDGATRGQPSLRVAILDKGFYGYEKEIGKSIPQNTHYHEGPVAPSEDLKVTHGLAMAQIFTSLVTDEGRYQPSIELHLYNVFGFSNFEAAVDDLVERGVDLILYSEVWEYGGNFDGRGFINAAVSKAVDAGALWVNASGNFAKHTYNGRIDSDDDGWLKLPDRNNALEIRCEPQGEKTTCPIRVVLSWNDFGDTTDQGTDKDLDLALTDDLLNILQTAALKQSSDPEEGRPGYSKYPREILSVPELPRGTYYIRIKDQSRGFTERDRFRVAVSGEFLTMTTFDRNENLLIPADHPKVITVGANDSELSSRSRSMNKPEIMAPSSIVLRDGESEYRGSSNSAAIVAAGIALMKLNGYHGISREEIINLLGSGWGGGGQGSSYDGRDRHSGPVVGGYHRFDEPHGHYDVQPEPGYFNDDDHLGFAPTGQGCFLRAVLPQAPFHIQRAIAQGAVLVVTTDGFKLMVEGDPYGNLGGGVYRDAFSSRVVLGPQGARLVPRGHNRLAPHEIEVFQRPGSMGLCDGGLPNRGMLH